MSVSWMNNLVSETKDFLFGEEVEVRRNPTVRLQNQEATAIDEGTQLRVQYGCNPSRQVTVKDYVGNPNQDSQFNQLGDPSTRLKNLLDNTQYRHRSNDAQVDKQGVMSEPNGAVVAPLARPKVSVDVERSKVRNGDTALQADNGAVIVPTADELAR